MPDCSFYAKARAGFPQLVTCWRHKADATDERALIILSDTARLMEYSPPETPIAPEQLATWSALGALVPLWLIKALVFLMTQMPARPSPHSETEAAAWVYGWLRLRTYTSPEEARARIPAHLQAALTPLIAAGWEDLTLQRLA